MGAILDQNRSKNPSKIDDKIDTPKMSTNYPKVQPPPKKKVTPKRRKIGTFKNIHRTTKPRGPLSDSRNALIAEPEKGPLDSPKQKSQEKGHLHFWFRGQ